MGLRTPGVALLALQQFSDGLPQAVDKFPYYVAAALVAAVIYRYLRSR